MTSNLSDLNFVNPGIHSEREKNLLSEVMTQNDGLILENESRPIWYHSPFICFIIVTTAFTVSFFRFKNGKNRKTASCKIHRQSSSSLKLTSPNSCDERKFMFASDDVFRKIMHRGSSTLKLLRSVSRRNDKRESMIPTDYGFNEQKGKEGSYPKKLNNVEDFETEPDSDEEEIALPSPLGVKASTSNCCKRTSIDRTKLVSQIKMFAYLNMEAIDEVVNHIQFIPIRKGQALLKESGNDGRIDSAGLDGSLYYVLSGELMCMCRLNTDFGEKINEKDNCLSFTVGKGKVVNSILDMLSSMVKNYQHQHYCLNAPKNQVNKRLQNMHDIQFNATATQDGTELIRFPASCFLSILNKHPQDFYRMVNYALSRSHRISMLTLVKDLGLSSELLRLDNASLRASEKNSVNLRKQRSAKINMSENNLSDNQYISKTLDAFLQQKLDQTTNSFKRDAVDLAALHLGVDTLEGKGRLFRESSIIYSLSGDILINAGKYKVGKGILFILSGSLNVELIAEKKNEVVQPDATSFDKKSITRDTSSLFKHLQEINPGHSYGLFSCFLEEEVGFIRVRAKLNSTILFVPVKTFESLLKKHPNAIIKSLKYVFTKVISPVVFLFDWGLYWLHIKGGEILTTKGNPCESLYLVLSGSLQAVGTASENTKFSRGACIGDVQVLTSGVWPHDIVAVRYSELAMIPSSVLEIIMHKFPRSGLHFAKVIANQVQRKHQINQHKVIPSYELKIATITVIPLALSSKDECTEFCKILVQSLNGIAPTTLMTKERARNTTGKFMYRNAIHQLKLTRLLGEIEEKHRLVVYQAQNVFSWWSKICIEQADCVLLLVHANSIPEAKQIEKFLEWKYESRKIRIELVVLQSPSHNINYAEGDVDKLSSWSERQPWISGHHLVRFDCPNHEMDVKRMCRRICGCSIGLVLGGGGAKGLGHLGVIKALRELGVTIDMVGGTSQGSFIAALFAKNPDHFDNILEASRKMAGAMTLRSLIFDLTFPVVSYFSTKRTNKMLAQILGKNTRIQDLVLKFFCVSTDVSNCVQVVHTKGLCWKYVRASMSLFPFFPPVSDNGSLLMDGGYMNILPVDVMAQQMGARTVIAVDVSPDEKKTFFQYGTHLNGLWLLWNKWNPLVKTVQVPTMSFLNEQLIWVSCSRHRNNTIENADLLLSLPLPYSTVDYDKFDEIVDISYTYAKPRIEQFLKENPSLIS